MDVNELVNLEPLPMSYNFPTIPFDHLPSPHQVAQARANVQSCESEIISIENKIQEEKAALASLLEAHDIRIKTLLAKENELRDQVSLARAYLAPIRKLPSELLGEVFIIIFSGGDTKCGWTLASVSKQWRRVALGLHIIWSSISLTTTTSLCPADTVRLWLERSGPRCPLDIDITLKSTSTNSSPEKTLPTSRRRLFPGGTPHALPSLWSAVGGASSHPHASSSLSPPHGAHSTNQNTNDTDVPWGYIVFYYLVAQLHRWRRFRFMFGTPFSSLKALDTIQGSAPLLEEFVVGCTESSCFPPSSEQWQWLPSYVPQSNSTPSLPLPTPNLTSLELRNVPFRWSSPLLSNLRKLKLVSNNLTVHPLTLNRILNIIQSSPQLEVLELSVVAQSHILPLCSVTLHHLRDLKLGCSQGQNSLLQQLIGQLITPALTSLTIEADSRSESSVMTETLTGLLVRSGLPMIKSFSYGLASTSTSGPSPYSAYGSLGFPTNLLRQFHHLEQLTVTSCPIEPILVALASTTQNQDDEDNESEFGPPGPTGGFGAPALPPTTIQFGNLANALHSTTNVNLHNTANLPNIIATAATNLAAAVAAAATAPSNVNVVQQFNDEYLCPHLKSLTFKHCHPHPDGIVKIIRMVQARNPDGETASGLQSVPGRIKTLEFSECGHIGGDVITWLEDRIENVVYTEAQNNNHTSFRGNGPYGFGF